MNGVIYKVSCSGNGAFLYGSTINFKQRVRGYLKILRKNKYSNRYLQNCYNKYGRDSINFEIVQDNIPREILELVESIWMGFNCSRIEDKKGGMNMKDGTATRISEETKERLRTVNLGKKASQETRDKIRIASTGRKMSEEGLRKMRLRKMSPENKEKLLKVNTGRYYSEETRKKMSQSALGKIISETSRALMSQNNSRRKEVIQLDLEGNYLNEYSSSVDAEKKTGIDHSGIMKCCRGKLKTAGKFIWKFKQKLNE